MSEASFDRARALERLGAEAFDVLVVGAGITGAGVALDAASRGLRTAMVERRDFAYGTSSRSSKLVHGGIRYLQQGDLRLVYHGLSERQRLLKNAPHLVRPLGFLLPIYKKGGLVPRILSRLFGVVLWFYDHAGGSGIVGRHRRLTRDEAVAHMPTLDGDRVHSAYMYFDGQADDARLTLTLARTAADHGAVVANYAPVTAIRKDASGRVVGATVDTGDGTIDITARVVVNAAGVWVDDVESLDDSAGEPTMRPARGVHIVVPASVVRNDVAVILPAPGQLGSVFAVPWGDFTYIGTTDTDYTGSLDDPWCTADDLTYLTGNINASMTSRVSPDDVVGGWVGMRPLVAGEAGKTADLSRRHRVTRSASGVVTVAGGKLTTYRLMAQDTVDEVLKVLGRKARCVTKALRLRGAAGHEQVDEGGLGPSVRDHLVNRYGADARVVIAMAAADADLARPLVPGLPYLRAEAVYAAEHEMARNLDDVLSHRTRSRLLARDASAEAAESVAGLIAGPLGWSPEKQAAEVERYRASVAEERGAASSPAPGIPTGDVRASEGWVPGIRMPRSFR